MSAVAFDTLKAKKTLTGVGVEEEVAEAFVAVAGNVVPENVATKADIGNLKADIGNLKAGIGTLKVGIERDMARLEVRLTNRITVLFGTGIAILGFIIVAIRFIPGN